MKKLLCLSLMLLTPIVYAADMASITVHTEMMSQNQEEIKGPILIFDVDLHHETLYSLAQKIKSSPALKSDANFKHAQLDTFYWYKNNIRTLDYIPAEATLHDMGITKGQDIFAHFSQPLMMFMLKKKPQ